MLEQTTLKKKIILRYEYCNKNAGKILDAQWIKVCHLCTFYFKYDICFLTKYLKKEFNPCFSFNQDILIENSLL